ncbi:hypothetical protein ABBQ38_012259 [Trebouxia sp. C0009 RCD-2024]
MLSNDDIRIPVEFLLAPPFSLCSSQLWTHSRHWEQLNSGYSWQQNYPASGATSAQALRPLLTLRALLTKSTG